ncbi:hypothetical protein Tco_0392733 [Tanacetum coccineum]
MICQNPCSYPRLELKKTASCHHPSLNMETPVPLLFSSLVLLVKQTMDLAIDYLHPVWAHNNQHPSDLKPETYEKHGSDPEWEYGLKIELREPYELDAVAVFEIMHESSTMIDIRIGKVKVPVKHFTGHAKKLSYPVLLSNGKSMGELIMSSMISTPDGDKREDGDHLQAYIPTLEVPNGRARPSRLLSASNGIGLLALPLGPSNVGV